MDDLHHSGSGSVIRDCDLLIEAVGFADAARVWLDYGLCGHVELGAALKAAQRLLRRADRWWEVAA